MCVILSIFQNKHDPDIIQALTSAVGKLEWINDDGVGIVGFNLENNQSLVKREMKVSEKEIQEILSKYHIVNIHLRTATAGRVNKDNIHFWQAGRWLFAHNGYAYEYGNKFGEEFCDSLIFFRELLAKKCLPPTGRIKWQKIKKIVNTNYFLGRFVIIDKESQKVYFFGDFQTYLLNNSVLAITSAKLHLSTFQTFWGLLFARKEPKLEIIRKSIEGIFVADLKKKTFKFFEEEDLMTTNYGYQGKKYKFDRSKDGKLVTI